MKAVSVLVCVFFEQVININFNFDFDFSFNFINAYKLLRELILLFCIRIKGLKFIRFNRTFIINNGSEVCNINHLAIGWAFRQLTNKKKSYLLEVLMRF